MADEIRVVLTEDERSTDLSALYHALLALPENVEFEVRVRKRRPVTENQRAYYWWICRYLETEMANDIEIGGWEADDFHKWFKSEAGLISTKTLESADQWTAYLDIVIRLASQRFHVAVPDPE